MRIALISHSDLNGGAAIVTYRLMKALRRAGHDARMLVTERLSDDPDVMLLGSAYSRRAAFLAERLDIFMRNGFSRKRLFRVSTGSAGVAVADHPFVRQADAIMLGWINQGTISLREIERLAALGKPMVWTMHDLWCMTGICHHPYGCTNFRESCGRCKFLSWMAGSHDLSHSVWRAKMNRIASLPIKYVAVSNWVKQRALESSLLADKDVTVIPNAFDPEMFPIEARHPIDGVDGRRVIIFGAANLNDPVKGLDYAIDALNILADSHPEIVADTVALFFGRVKNHEPFTRLRFPYKLLGPLIDAPTLSNAYSNASVVVSTSLYECLPGTLIEGMSAGAVPVTFGEGGQVDIVEHGVNGFIANYLDVGDMAACIARALTCGISRSSLHASVASRFSAPLIASRYLSLLTTTR